MTRAAPSVQVPSWRVPVRIPPPSFLANIICSFSNLVLMTMIEGRLQTRQCKSLVRRTARVKARHAERGRGWVRDESDRPSRRPNGWALMGRFAAVKRAGQ